MFPWMPIFALVVFGLNFGASYLVERLPQAIATDSLDSESTQSITDNLLHPLGIEEHRKFLANSVNLTTDILSPTSTGASVKESQESWNKFHDDRRRIRRRSKYKRSEQSGGLMRLEKMSGKHHKTTHESHEKSNTLSLPHRPQDDNDNDLTEITHAEGEAMRKNLHKEHQGTRHSKRKRKKQRPKNLPSSPRDRLLEKRRGRLLLPEQGGIPTPEFPYKKQGLLDYEKSEAHEAVEMRQVNETLCPNGHGQCDQLCSVNRETGQHECSCFRGYTMIQGQCQKTNGKGAGFQATCEPLFPPLHGYLECTRNLVDPDGSRKNHVGTVCTLKCSMGYQAVGAYKRTCSSHGKWRGADKGTCIDGAGPEVVACPRDQSVTVENQFDTAQVHWPLPEFLGNVAVSSVVGSHHPGSQFTLGSHKVTYTATDTSGHTAECVFRIIVRLPQ